MHSSYVLAPRYRFSQALAVVALFALLVGIAPRPARADTGSTTAVLLGAAAAAAAIIISNNVRHKQAQANTPVGRTQDGGTILGDGRVVYPNGDVLYTGNGGRRCTYDGYGAPCSNQPVVYYPRSYNGANHGHHYGWDKHRERRENEDEQGDDRGKHGNHGHHGDHDD